jgi:hypothetical protein
MKIYCMHCGHPIDVGRGYDNYQGPLRCAVCKSLMTVRIRDGDLHAMELGAVVVVAAARPAVPTSEATARTARPTRSRPAGSPPSAS